MKYYIKKYEEPSGSLNPEYLQYQKNKNYPTSTNQGELKEKETALDGTQFGNLFDKAYNYSNKNYNNLAGAFARAVDGTRNLYNNVREGGLSFLPGVGDAVDVVSIGDDVNKGNYGSAALTAGLMVLPGSASKAKQLGKDFLTGLESIYKKGIDFEHASKYKRLLKSVVDAITHPKKTISIGENKDIFNDYIPIYDVPKYSDKQFKDFFNIVKSEQNIGPYSNRGTLQFINPGDSPEHITKEFNKARILKQNEDLAKRYGEHLTYKFNKMYDELKDNGVYKSILDESPQYIDLIYRSFKRGENPETLLKRLIDQSNSYRRFMSKDLSAQDFATFKGRSIGIYDKSSIDVEGLHRSDVNMEYGTYPAYFQGQPKITGDVNTWWSQRVPSGVTVKKGMHDRDPYQIKLISKIPNEYMDLSVIQEFNKHAPKQYTTWPTHQVFIGDYGQTLPNFKITVGEKPSDFIWGRGYKQGGKLKLKTNELVNRNVK